MLPLPFIGSHATFSLLPRRLLAAMPPPRRLEAALGAAQASSRPALGLLSLPDGLLVRCLEPLGHKARCD